MGFIGEVLFTLLWAVSLGVTLLFVATRMLLVGLAVTGADLRTLGRERSFVVRALLANVLVVPALGLAIALTLPLATEAMLAILLLAAVGGGVDFLARAERPRADTRSLPALIFLLSIVAVVITPTIRLLLQPAGAPMVASLWRLVGVSVLVVLVPLVGGALIRRTDSTVAEVLSKAMAVVAVVLFVAAALTTLLVKAPTIRTVGASGILAMIVLVVAAAATGWLLGGPSLERRALLARVTAMRNVGLSLLLAIVSFPDSGVDVAVLLFAAVEVSLRLLATVLHGTVVPSMPLLSRRGRRS